MSQFMQGLRNSVPSSYEWGSIVGDILTFGGLFVAIVACALGVAWLIVVG